MCEFQAIRWLYADLEEGLYPTSEKENGKFPLFHMKAIVWYHFSSLFYRLRELQDENIFEILGIDDGFMNKYKDAARKANMRYFRNSSFHVFEDNTGKAFSTKKNNEVSELVAKEFKSFVMASKDTVGFMNDLGQIKNQIELRYPLVEEQWNQLFDQNFNPPKI